MLIVAVATDVSLDSTVTLPWAFVTVNVPLFGYAIVPLDLLIVIGFVPLDTVHVYFALEAL